MQCIEGRPFSIGSIPRENREFVTLRKKSFRTAYTTGTYTTGTYTTGTYCRATTVTDNLTDPSGLVPIKTDTSTYTTGMRRAHRYHNHALRLL